MQTNTGNNLVDPSPEALTEWLSGQGEKPFRAAQILRWLFRRGAESYLEMTDIRTDLRHELAETFAVPRLKILDTRVSADGSKKFLFGLRDGLSIESVLMYEKDHATLCVSSQVGCAQGCVFCRTGEMGFKRNLTSFEILAQVCGVRFSLENPDHLTNIVFMGMGEPLANFDNVVTALNVLSEPTMGMKFAARRITVSTVGLVPKIPALGRDTRARLAVSLNAADDETRTRLMPINRKYPIAELLESLRDFPLKTGKRITFEYVMLKGVNDSMADARNLVRILSHTPAKINLIPFNPHEGSPFERPTDENVIAFREYLANKNFTAMVRYSKGLDVGAACGQLASAGP